MSRSNIFELLSNSSVENDLLSIDYLIHSSQFRYIHGYHTFTSTIEQHANRCFHKWTMRGTAISLLNVRERIGISELKTFIKNSDNQITYLEYAYNVLDLFRNVKDYPSCIESPEYINAVHCCELTIDKLSLKPEKLSSKFGTYILVPADPSVISVAERVGNIDVKLQILQYHHHLLKGNLEKKKSILLAMSLLFEDDKAVMEKSSFHQLTKDIGFVLNNFNIRHTISDSPFSALSTTELESIYDDLYEMLITWFSALTYNNEISIKIEKYRLSLKHDK